MYDFYYVLFSAVIKYPQNTTANIGQEVCFTCVANTSKYVNVINNIAWTVDEQQYPATVISRPGFISSTLCILASQNAEILCYATFGIGKSNKTTDVATAYLTVTGEQFQLHAWLFLI